MESKTDSSNDLTLVRLIGRQVDSDQDGLTTKVFEVSLAGLQIKLKTSHDEEIVRQLIEFVDKKVIEATHMTKSGSIQNAAFLACLNIAEELLMLKKRAIGEIEKIQSRAHRVISELESSQEGKLKMEH